MGIPQTLNYLTSRQDKVPVAHGSKQCFNSAQMLDKDKLALSKSDTNILWAPFFGLVLILKSGLHAFGDVLQPMCQ